jgi:hypothetical protein
MVLWKLVGDINKLSLEATTKRFVGWVVGEGEGQPGNQVNVCLDVCVDCRCKCVALSTCGLTWRMGMLLDVL